MENFGKFMALIVAFVVNPIIRGFVFCKLWLWFAVPMFEVHPLRIVDAIGLLILIEFARLKKENSSDSSGESFWSNLGGSIAFTIIGSSLALLLGWIVTLFL